MTGVFQKWQPVYAERGIATFPVREVEAAKRPAVRNYSRIGLPASAALTSRLGSAEMLGFMCGSRSRVSVLDVDSKDERILADALDQFGKTPVIVRTGSGKYHAWYRYNGERRRIRPQWCGRCYRIARAGPRSLARPRERTNFGGCIRRRRKILIGFTHDAAGERQRDNSDG